MISDPTAFDLSRRFHKGILLSNWLSSEHIRPCDEEWNYPSPTFVANSRNLPSRENKQIERPSWYVITGFIGLILLW